MNMHRRGGLVSAGAYGHAISLASFVVGVSGWAACKSSDVDFAPDGGAGGTATSVATTSATTDTSAATSGAGGDTIAAGSGAGGETTGTGVGGTGAGGGTGGNGVGGSGGDLVSLTCNGKKVVYGASEQVVAKVDGAKRIALDVDSTRIVWIERKNGGLVGEAWSHELANKQNASLATGLNNANSIAIGQNTFFEETIYIAELGTPLVNSGFKGDGRVATVPAKGGAVTKIWETTDSSANLEIVASGSKLMYWIDLKNYPLVVKLNTEKGTTEQYVTNAAPKYDPDLSQLAFNTKSLIWATPQGVSLVDKATKAIVKVADFIGAPVDLAADDEMAFWTTEAGHVQGALLSGHTITFDVADDAPTAVAVEGEVVYWLNAKGLRAACKKDKETNLMIATGKSPTAMRLMGDTMYWIDGDGAIKRFSKSLAK
jgi:hypothetical protein